MTSCNLLASSTNLYSVLTADWLLVPGNYYSIVCSLAGASSLPQDSVASFVCILPHDVCQPKYKHNNIAPTITTEIKNLRQASAILPAY